MHQNDYNQLILYSSVIKKYIPSFDVSIQGNYGEIRMNGSIRFHTTGPATDNVILAYVTALMTGLTYKKQ